MRFGYYKVDRTKTIRNRARGQNLSTLKLKRIKRTGKMPANIERYSRLEKQLIEIDSMAGDEVVTLSNCQIDCYIRISDVWDCLIQRDFEDPMVFVDFDILNLFLSSSTLANPYSKFWLQLYSMDSCNPRYHRSCSFWTE